MDPIDISSLDTLPARVSAVFTFTTMALSFGYCAIVGARFLRLRRLVRLAERQEAGALLDGAKTTPGIAVLHGTVELARGQSSAVRLVLEQHGRSYKDKQGNSRHVWSEVARRVDVQPFYLSVAGARFRVEPDSSVLFDDDFDVFERTGATTRHATAQLAAGEEVTVVGDLVVAPDPEAAGAGTGYRTQGNADAALVLRPPARVPMRIATRPLAERYRKEASWPSLGIGLGLAHAIGLTLFASPYLVRLVFGNAVHAEVAAKRTGTERRKNHEYPIYYVDLRAPSGLRFAEQVDETTFVRVNVGDRVNARVAKAFGSAQLGADAAIHAAVPIAGIIPLVLLIVLSFLISRQTSTVDHRGDGDL